LNNLKDLLKDNGFIVIKPDNNLYLYEYTG
jgi:hypothetical protein